MGTFSQLLLVEWMKIRKSKNILLILLLMAIPVFYGIIIQTQIVIGTHGYDSVDVWFMLMMMVLLFYGTIFLPNIISVLTGTFVEFEKQANNWEYLFVKPAKKIHMLLSKLVWICIFTVAVQLLMIGLVVISGLIAGYEEAIPIETFTAIVLLGSLGTVSLGIMLFYFYLCVTSTRVVLIINIVLSLPVFLVLSIAEDSLVPFFYPWALPLIGMTHAFSTTETLIVFLLECTVLIVLFAYLSMRRLHRGAME